MEEINFNDPVKQFDAARSGMLAVLGFTLVNIFLVVAHADFYFLFSAYIPIELLHLLSDFNIDTFTFSYTALGIGAAIIATSICGIVWYFSGKNRALVIVALVYFAIDVLLSIPWYIDSIIIDSDMFTLIEVGIAAYILYLFVMGTVAWYQLRSVPHGSGLSQSDHDVIEDGEQDNSAAR